MNNLFWKGGDLTIMKNKVIVTTVIVAVAAGGSGFLGGMKYQQSRPRQFGNSQPGGRNGQFAGGNRMGPRPVAGDIIASDEKSITVKLTDGSSRIIILSDKTEINKAEEAKKVDLKIGEKVAVFGQENSDGSVTAQNIQLNPIRIMNSGSSPRQK